MKLLGLITLMYLIVAVSGLVLVAAILGSFAIKKKVFKMDGEKWDVYFKSLSNSDYILRFGALYFISLSTSIYLGYFLFIAFNFQNPVVLSAITFVYGAVKITFKLYKNKATLIDKISKFEV